MTLHYHFNFVSLLPIIVLYSLLILLLSSALTCVCGAVNDSSSPHLLINHQNHIYTTNRPQHYDFCGPPPMIAHAQCNLMQNQRHNVFKVGTIATYTCDQGFVKTSGEELLRCLPRDEIRPPRWELPSLKCEIVNCTDPGFVENATRSTGTFAYNTIVEYKCLAGFRMIGVPFLTCRDTGLWNRDKPICQLKQCPELQPLAYGRVLYSDIHRVSDSRAEYICDYGYKFNFPHSVRYCRHDDSWSNLSDIIDTFPECSLVSCDVPVRPHSGLRIINIGKKKVFQPGDIIIYLCHSGVKASSKCLPDGSWQRGPPHCPTIDDIYCSSFGEFLHGSFNGSSPFQTLSRIAFKCEDNYILQGPPMITCLLSGKWSDNAPKCVKSELQTHEKTSSQLTILVTCISILSVIIFFISFVLICRWRQQKLERRRWQRYFGNYNHRQSKTNITLNTNEMKCFRQSPKPTVPVTDL